MDSSKTLRGTGTVKSEKDEYRMVKYQMVIEYTGAPPTIVKIDASIISPPECIRALAGETGTLILENGAEVDGLFNADGHIAVFNYGNALRGL